MILELSRSLLRKNFPKIMTKSSQIEKRIDDLAGASEGIINKEIFNQLTKLSEPNLGIVQFKNRIFKISIDVEKAISHSKICEMALSEPVRTELGDLIIAVDHIFVDLQSVISKSKIIGGACSIVQTKKESYAKKGLSARQLYLMTQWPKFNYKGEDVELKILPDLCSFYLFVLEPSSNKRKTNLLSSSILSRLLGVGKKQLLANIKGTFPLPNIDLITRDNNEVLPFSLSSFLWRSLYLSVGSQSIELRSFLRHWFFSSIEEIEDCVTTTQVLKQDTDFGNWFPKKMDQNANDEDILAVRLKVIIRRIE